MSDQIVRRYAAEDRAREAAEEIPVGCYGEPADIAHLACFLASPLARYIPGAVIPVDGGLRRYQFWSADGSDAGTVAPPSAADRHRRVQRTLVATMILGSI
jgi:hypothetical protein